MSVWIACHRVFDNRQAGARRRAPSFPMDHEKEGALSRRQSAASPVIVCEMARPRGGPDRGRDGDDPRCRGSTRFVFAGRDRLRPPGGNGVHVTMLDASWAEGVLPLTPVWSPRRAGYLVTPASI